MPNTYTERSHMWVLQLSIDNAGYRIKERRNLIMDVQKIFGKLILIHCKKTRNRCDQ